MSDFITERSEMGTCLPSKDCNIKSLDQRRQQTSTWSFDFLKDDAFSCWGIGERACWEMWWRGQSRQVWRGRSFRRPRQGQGLSEWCVPPQGPWSSMAGVLSPSWGCWQGTPCCQATKTPRRAHHPRTRVSPGSSVSLFYPGSLHFQSVTKWANVSLVWHLVGYVHSELGVGPGIFHIFVSKSSYRAKICFCKGLSKALEVKSSESSSSCHARS